MSDTVRTIFAFLLIAIILIFTPKYLQWLNPTPEPGTEPSPADTLYPAQAETKEQAPITPTFAVPLADAERPVHDSRSWTVENDLYRAEVSNMAGGSFVSFKLKKYDSGVEDGPVEIVSELPFDGNVRIDYINLDGDSVYTAYPFEVLEGPSGKHIIVDDHNVHFRFRYTFPSGASVEKTLTFQPDSYVIPATVTWHKPILELGLNHYAISWPGGLAPTEKHQKEDETYGKVYVYQGDELEEQGSSRGDNIKRQTLKGNTGWVATRNKYFAVAFIARETSADYGAYSAINVPVYRAGISGEDYTRYNMAMGYNADRTATFDIYVGPLSYDILKSLEADLDRVMNFGFALIRPISKYVVLKTLVFFYSFIPNYGIVLILFALIIRIVTNPLTRKSALSGQKMQLIQPKIKELQEKYKGNAQKLNQEMMALWRQEGVNPFGGCLPILIQMPLLWALFIVFRSTIELRGAPFALWVQDLSAPDFILTLPFTIPLYGSGVSVLAIIMGTTMFLQQKISGAANNPQQKPMMYFMTVFFFLIFNSFPSGLNLYYAFSNILAIIQQRNIRKQLAAAPAAATATVKATPRPAQKGPKKRRR